MIMEVRSWHTFTRMADTRTIITDITATGIAIIAAMSITITTAATTGITTVMDIIMAIIISVEQATGAGSPSRLRSRPASWCWRSPAG